MSNILSYISAWLKSGVPPHYVWVLVGLYVLDQDILKKTKVVRANSNVELLFNALNVVLLPIFGKFPIIGQVLALLDTPAPAGTVVSPVPPVAPFVPPALPPAAALLPFLLFFTVGCATPGGAAFGKCELNQLPQIEQTVVVDVTSIALTGGVGWQNDLSQIGNSLAPGQLTCILQALVAAWEAKASHAALSQPYIDALIRLKTYLATQKASAHLSSRQQREAVNTFFWDAWNLYHDGGA